MVLHNRSLFNNTSINSSSSSINLVCNGIGVIEFELTDSIAASAIFSIITNMVLSIVSVIGNGLTVYVIAFRPGFTSFAFRGIIMISVISIFHSCVTQVLFTVTRFHDLIDYHDCKLKLVADALAYTTQCGLYTTITALAIDRYIAVVHHQYYSTMKVHYIYVTLSIITVIIWMPLITLSFLKILTLTVFRALVSSYLLLHFVVIAFTYVRVMLQLAIHHKHRVQHLGASMREEEIEKQRRMEERRQNSVLFIIGVHALCLLAKAGCFAVRAGLPTNHELEYHCQRSTQFFLIFNAALYPILYAWRIDVLRTEMVRILKGKLCCVSSGGVEANA